VDVTDSFKIEGDNIKEIKEDFQETVASPTRAPQSKPFARKSTLLASFRVWFPFANLSIGNITKPFIGGLNSFWWPRINLVLRGKLYEKEIAMIQPYALAYQPVKFLLFDNNLTRYLDRMWENQPSQDMAKISGKELVNMNNQDIAYLKSITDGA
jgi:hypothetical protein